MTHALAEPETRVEKVAWRTSRSSPRFFQLAGFVAGASILLASAGAAYVYQRNASAVAAAQDHRQVVTSITQFRSHLSLADTEVAVTLVSGEPASTLGEARYEAELLDANRSLTNAGLFATGQAAADIAELAAGLGRYARLVETSRAYPVGSTFAEHAREEHDDLVRRNHDETAAGGNDEEATSSAGVRSAAEDDLADAAERVAGWGTTVALAGLGLATLTLLATITLVAGRTRHRLHWALVGAVVLMGALAAAVVPSLRSQRDEMRSVARAELEAFAAANENAFALFDLRTKELEAVASDPTDQDLYTQLPSEADRLIGRLGPCDEDAGVAPPTLPCAVRSYVQSVVRGEDLHNEDGNQAAADFALVGDSAVTYRVARETAVGTVNRSGADLTERLEAAAEAEDVRVLPVGVTAAALVLGTLAAGLAVTGVVLRGWDHLSIGRRL